MASPSDTASDGALDEAYCSTCSRSFSIDTLVCPDDGARLVKLAAQRDDIIGRVLDGRYEIRAPLGKGGMGTVYRGWQLSVDREVAIKLIHPRLAGDRETVKRFLREAKLASRLNQPSIVNVYDFGQSDTLLYLVMELLRGHTLASELGDGRRLNLRRTAVIGSQLCDALEAAHAQDIVHRDLKPSNIVILDDPPGRDLIKVLDFGLAKSLVYDSGSQVTNPDAMLGTPLYMAPEQIEGKVSDQRADLYSLGCILYEMISGAPPFVDNVVSAVLARHLTEAPAPLPSHVPPRLRVLVETLLAKVPEKRIQAAAEVRDVLAYVLETSARATPVPIDVPDTMPEIRHGFAETSPPAPATPNGPSSRGWLAVGLATVVVGGLAFILMRFTSESTQSAVPADARVARHATSAVDALPIDAAPLDATPVDAAPIDATSIDAAPRPQTQHPIHHPATSPPRLPDDPSVDFVPRPNH